MKKFTQQKEFIESGSLEYLTENQNSEVDILVEKAYVQWVEAGSNIEDLNEGFFRKLLGGTAGFIVGPTIGKLVAKALGINSGVLYDLLTSRLVSAALGAALANSIKST